MVEHDRAYPLFKYFIKISRLCNYLLATIDKCFLSPKFTPSKFCTIIMVSILHSYYIWSIIVSYNTLTHYKLILLYCDKKYLLERVPQYNGIFSEFQYLMHTTINDEDTCISLCA